MRKLPILKELEQKFGSLGLFIDNRKHVKRIKIFKCNKCKLSTIERYINKNHPNIKLSYVVNPNGVFGGYYDGLVLKIERGDPSITITK